MSTVFAIAQRKGGVGKTTLACQLAAAFQARGARVSLLDADDQGSLGVWAGLRRARLGKLDMDYHDASGFKFTSALAQARRQSDITIIDTAPTIDAAVKRACTAADYIVAPLQLSPLDLDASMPTSRLAASLRRPILFVINRAPPRARVAELIRDRMRNSKLPVAQTELGNRAAFAESIATGRGVIETERNGPAAQEILALTDELTALSSRGARAA